MICLCFLLCQFVALFLVTCIAQLLGRSPQDDPAVSLACRFTTVLLGGCLTLAIATAMGMIRWKTVFRRPPLPPTHIGGTILSSLVFILGLNLFSEMVALPDNNADIIQGMVHHPLGVLIIAVFSPVVEELVFRESMINDMQRQGMSHWSAILISALAFGLIHANPAQIPFAMIMGVFFGYLYWKTGNIWLTSILHILNNGLAVALILTYGSEATLSEMVGMGLPVWVVASSLCLFGGWGTRRMV